MCLERSGLSACLCLLLAVSVQAQWAEFAKGFNLSALPATVDQIVKGLQTAFTPTGLKVTPTDLPAIRPPPNADDHDGWSFCDFACASSYTVNAGNMGSTGILSLDVSFKPLPGVSAAAMVWLLRNLHKDAVYYRDNKTYPMYQILHGVDHCKKHDASSDQVKTGTLFTWCEIPLTGCQYKADSATVPWVCPKQQAGFLSGDNTTKWAEFHQSKQAGKFSMVVTWFNSTGIEFASTLDIISAPIKVSRTIATTRHIWKETSGGLLLTSKTFLGLMKDGSNIDFDSSPLAPTFNKVIKATYLNNKITGPAGNITAVGYMNVLHFLQEYGNTPLWLPTMYADALDAAAASAAADAAASLAASGGRAAAAAARQAALELKVQQQAPAKAQREAAAALTRAAILAARQS